MAAKEPIRLRRRATATGNISLYLDIYINGRRSYEYLKLYLISEKTRLDKEKNRQTLQLAEAIKAKRIVELQNGEFGFASGSSANTSFIDYFEALGKERAGTDKDNNIRGCWQACLNHIRIFEKRSKIRFSDITPEWVRGFRDYLEKKAYSLVRYNGSESIKQPLARNTAAAYYAKFKACINQAVKERIINANPCAGIGNISPEDATRMYLTIDEVRKLADTECRHDSIKRAFLFSCLTGLRHSDIERLQWGDVHQQDDLTRIIFRQKKTKGQEYLDITPQAAEIMGERKNPDEHVFCINMSVANVNKNVQRWVDRAGIDKKITFHCARHTFAVMMLDLGADIYTVSKLLGHREISTTQVYAKVLDKNKQAAVRLIPTILPERND